MTEVVGPIFQQPYSASDLEEKTGSTTKAAMGEQKHDAERSQEAGMRQTRRSGKSAR